MPKPSRQSRPINLPKGVDPATVSLACATDSHQECLGRVAVPRDDGLPGRTYRPCLCPPCGIARVNNHGQAAT